MCSVSALSDPPDGVHEGGFGVERYGEHGIRFRRPDGCLIAPAGAQRPVTGHGLEYQHRVYGPAINANTCRPLSAGDPLDYGLAVECLIVAQERKRRIVELL